MLALNFSYKTGLAGYTDMKSNDLGSHWENDTFPLLFVQVNLDHGQEEPSVSSPRIKTDVGILTAIKRASLFSTQLSYLLS